MQRVIDFIQPIQDAFAYQSRLSLFITDQSGKPITQLSEQSLITSLVQQDYQLIQENWLSQTKELSLYDVTPGIQVCICPIHFEGEQSIYLWAGPIIEQETYALLTEYLALTEQAETWHNALLNTPILSTQEKKEKLQIIKTFVKTVCELYALTHTDDSLNRLIVELESLTRTFHKQGVSEQIISVYYRIFNQFDCVGLALKEQDAYRIVNVVGDAEFQALIGTSFITGEGFLGQVAVTGEFGFWRDIELDPRSVFFKKQKIHINSLLCYPIKLQDTVTLILFCGAKKNQPIFPLAMKTGHIIANLIGHAEASKQLEQNAFSYLQRLDALMEVAQLITRTQDIRKIAIMLVDMTMNLLQSQFASIALFSPIDAPHEVRMVSRGLTEEQSNQYGKILLGAYHKQQPSNLFQNQLPITTRTLECGEKVIECPLYNQRLFGVLSIPYQENQEEHKAFLTSLAAIGATALHHALKENNDFEQGIDYLHKALRHWRNEEFHFTNELREVAFGFVGYIAMSELDQNLLLHASKLVPYEINFLQETLDHAVPILKILDDYHQLINLEQIADIQSTYHLCSKILALATYDIQSLNLHQLAVEDDLITQFEAYRLRHKVVDHHVSKEQQHSYTLAALSNRENEVMTLLIDGLNNKQIAKELFISDHTVKNHMTNIFQKLGVKDRAGLLAYYYQQQGLKK